MRIIYEEGDIVEVEDNMEAGPMAARTVKLLKESCPGIWEVEDVESPHQRGMVNKIYLQP